jgi:tRNA(adenine34) deaminase
MRVWDDLAVPWQACISEAWFAYCAGSLPIGAVITDAAGVILARGRNHIFEPYAGVSTFAGTRLAHAEIHALAGLDHRQVDLATCILYTTTEPCPMCTGAIRMCHVGTVRYIVRDPIAGGLTLLHANPFMQQRQCVIAVYDHPDLEAILVALYVAWVLRDNTPRLQPHLERLASGCPRGVRLGQVLHQRHVLITLQAQNASSEQMLLALTAELEGQGGRQVKV